MEIKTSYEIAVELKDQCIAFNKNTKEKFELNKEWVSIESLRELYGNTSSDKVFTRSMFEKMANNELKKRAEKIKKELLT